MSNTETQTTPNLFAALNAVNVNEHIEKKGGFSYLSWPWAVAQLRLADPTATWEVRRFDGRPYLLCEAGVFVEVAVTVQGVTLSQIHPVLDARNRPIAEPNAFEINTSIQRCLVKAIALHGLGLYIYAGEDLPVIADAGGEAANDANNDAAPQPPQAGNPIRATVNSAPSGSSVRVPTPRITRSQQAHILKLATEVGVNLERVLAYFGAKDLASLPANDFQRVVRSLENRRAA